MIDGVVHICMVVMFVYAFHDVVQFYVLFDVHEFSARNTRLIVVSKVDKGGRIQVQESKHPMVQG